MGPFESVSLSLFFFFLSLFPGIDAGHQFSTESESRREGEQERERKREFKQKGKKQLSLLLETAFWKKNIFFFSVRPFFLSFPFCFYFYIDLQYFWCIPRQFLLDFIPYSILLSGCIFSCLHCFLFTWNFHVYLCSFFFRPLTLRTCCVWKILLHILKIFICFVLLPNFYNKEKFSFF